MERPKRFWYAAGHETTGNRPTWPRCTRVSSAKFAASAARRSSFGPVRAIHLTPVYPTCSSCERGGLSTHARGIRAAVCDRGRLPGLLGSIALADGLPVSALCHRRGLDDSSRSDDVPPVWTPSFRYGGDDLPPKSPPAPHVVPHHVVGHQSEAWGERPWLAEVVGPGEL